MERGAAVLPTCGGLLELMLFLEAGRIQVLVDLISAALKFDPDPDDIICGMLQAPVFEHQVSDYQWADDSTVTTQNASEDGGLLTIKHILAMGPNGKIADINNASGPFADWSTQAIRLLPLEMIFISPEGYEMNPYKQESEWVLLSNDEGPQPEVLTPLVIKGRPALKEGIFQLGWDSASIHVWADETKSTEIKGGTIDEQGYVTSALSQPSQFPANTDSIVYVEALSPSIRSNDIHFGLFLSVPMAKKPVTPTGSTTSNTPSPSDPSQPSTTDPTQPSAPAADPTAQSPASGSSTGTSSSSSSDTNSPAGGRDVGNHATLLVAATVATQVDMFPPDVVRVNANFDEQKIDPVTKFAQPDYVDEDLKAASGPKAGKIITTDLSEAFFGYNPNDTFPDGFFDGATVTIEKLPVIDADSGKPESGNVRFYVTQGLGSAVEQFWAIPLKNKTTDGGAKTKDLVPLLYASNPAIPKGDGVQYWIEGIAPGPITLQFNVSKSGSSVLQKQVKFLVCTQQSKADWQQELRQQILLETGGAADMNNYAVPNGFVANAPCIKAVYSCYEELFKQRPDLFYWSGLAKLAGGPVYAGMLDAQIGQVAGHEALVRYAPRSVSILGDDIIKKKCTYVQNALTRGSMAIYSDMAWQFHAYQASGYWSLRYARENKLDTIGGDEDPIDLDTWKILFDAENNGLKNSCLTGNRNLTDREQNHTILPAWKDIAAEWPLTWLFSSLAKSPVDRGASFIEVVGSQGNVTKAEDRWIWVTDPQRGIWHDWTALSTTGQLGQVGVPLFSRAMNYSVFRVIISQFITFN